jgi:hypothetical protein
MLANLAPFFCFSFFFLGMMVTLVTSQNWPLKTQKKKKKERKGKKPLLLLLFNWCTLAMLFTQRCCNMIVQTIELNRALGVVGVA